MKKTLTTLRNALDNFLDKVDTAKENDAELKYETFYSSARILLSSWQTGKRRYNVFISFTELLPKQHFFFHGDTEEALYEICNFMDYLEKHFMFTLGELEG